MSIALLDLATLRATVAALRRSELPEVPFDRLVGFRLHEHVRHAGERGRPRCSGGGGTRHLEQSGLFALQRHRVCAGPPHAHDRASGVALAVPGAARATTRRTCHGGATRSSRPSVPRWERRSGACPPCPGRDETAVAFIRRFATRAALGVLPGESNDAMLLLASLALHQGDADAASSTPAPPACRAPLECRAISPDGSASPTSTPQTSPRFTNRTTRTDPWVRPRSMKALRG